MVKRGAFAQLQRLVCLIRAYPGRRIDSQPDQTLGSGPINFDEMVEVIFGEC